MFGDTKHRELRPRLGRQAALRYVHEIVTHPDWEPSNDQATIDEEPPLTQAMAALRRVTHPGSLAIVISDFIGLSRNAQSYLFEDRLATMEHFCQRYGIHLLHLSTEDDPIEVLQQALGRRAN